MTRALPKVKHVYQNYILDSTRWDRYEPRVDDIIIATPYKSGTTWMQNIVSHLVFLGQGLTLRLSQFSPWVENRVRPIDEVIADIQAQGHRRFIKSHLPLDGLPFHQEVKYIVVSRDARDVFMSMWNHYRNLTPLFYERVNEKVPGRVGPPIPPCPDDIGTFWYQWITRGWFDWEREGYPFWSNLAHVQSWWDFRQLPNVYFVHYADMLEDLVGEIGRIADFLNIEASEGQLASIADATNFTSMKANAEALHPEHNSMFKGGAQTFINKGTNGRWKNVLAPEDLSLYHEAVSRILSPSCRQWLENGRLAMSG